MFPILKFDPNNESSLTLSASSHSSHLHIHYLQIADFPRPFPTPRFLTVQFFSKSSAKFVRSSLAVSIPRITPTAPLKSSPSGSNLHTGSEDISSSPIPTSSDLKSSFTSGKLVRSYYLKTMSSLNPRAPVFIPSPRPLPPVPSSLTAINAAGYAFVAAYPNHPLATFAAVEVQLAGNERALLLYQKDKLRERMMMFHLEKLMLGTTEEKRALKSKGCLKEQELSVVLEYKTICAKLGQRPEVGRWFFRWKTLLNKGCRPLVASYNGGGIMGQMI
ncbi:hypothetical protein BHYA_0147g00230 [Botrytis hyacinthi]|uniref:Uncharacterized protein n=1 Tax=Botrytis hyacinthi TaxID=278943 RepID=A0A4Z1GHW3_9HELO|nr:hypothetical protein BHYA_0147g00230 [Botrytis hyacinthi]